MSTKTVKQTVCDACGKDVSKDDKSGKVGKADLCGKCLKDAMEEYEKVYNGRVRSRRGGWRQLGEYDG